jgi:Protein of unknown function (DUF2934)
MSEQNLPSSPFKIHSDEEAEIASLAYRIYCEEGCPAGRAHEHWLRAERDVRGQATASKPAATQVENPGLEQ